MFVHIIFHLLLVLIFIGFEPCHIAGDVLTRGSIKMLLLYTGWQLDAGVQAVGTCTTCV